MRSWPMQILVSPTTPSSRTGVHWNEMNFPMASLVIRYCSPETPGIREPESPSTCTFQRQLEQKFSI